MRKPACPFPLSSWTSSSSAAFSSVSSAASTSSAGSFYAPPSWRHHGEKKGKRSMRTRGDNTGAGGAVAVPRMNSSIYRGVTRHKASGKFEAHLWDKHARNPTTKKTGRQVYLGAFKSEDAAARTYDLAALKIWGPRCVLNFPLESYQQEREKMKRMTREGYLATLRRRSSGFSRGVSGYRGVTKHHHNGRWEARISDAHAGGKKYVYLGTFGSQEAAARAYDLAALEFRGPCAVTNFDISRYLQLQPPVPRRAQPPKPALLQLKDEHVGDALLSGAEPTTPPLLQTKPEPEEALPLGPALLDADDVDHAIAEILPALCMDPADFEARYPARARTGGCLQQQSDDLRGLLPLPDKSVMRFEDDIEALFDAAPGDEASRAAEDAISSLASGRWL